jgi:two-component system invasion response regulator UvrY
MLNILIADDHKIMRLAIIQIITDEWQDALCSEAADGAEFLTKAIQEKYDLVISDISMPVMNGLEAVTAIKKKLPGLPVIIISIHSENRYAINALKAGASGFIPKPHIQYELIKAMRIILSGKKYMTDELAIQIGQSG